jgi:organic hydroperoxide reductase OsmC/OhrA
MPPGQTAAILKGMRRARDITFPVSVTWVGGRLVRATAPEKRSIEIATPPEFKGTDIGVWSPEDFLVAAAASCFAVTFLAVAERREIPVHDLALDAVGRMGPGDDGRMGFQSVDLTAHVITDAGLENAAGAAALEAEKACFVSRALSVPVRLETVVRAALAA